MRGGNVETKGIRTDIRETLTGVTQLKIGDVYLFNILCLDVRKAFLYFDPLVFVLVRRSTPSQTSLNRILCLSISMGLPFLFKLVAVVSQCALCHGYKP